MINVRRHNPVLKERLAAFVQTGDADGLADGLSHLSHQDFRTAGFLLSEELFPLYFGQSRVSGDNRDFWHFFITMVPSSPKAYLGTFLKALAVLYENEAITLNDPRFLRYACEQAAPIDCRKILEMMLPRLKVPSEIESLLSMFSHILTPEQCASFLLRAGTLPCFYILFKLLKMQDATPELLRKYCVLLMRKGDHLSFNMACILHSYFDLSDLPGTFSLQLRPYQLGKLDESYEGFSAIIKN